MVYGPGNNRDSGPHLIQPSHLPTWSYWGCGGWRDVPNHILLVRMIDFKFHLVVFSKEERVEQFGVELGSAGNSSV